jgi:arylformamidase
MLYDISPPITEALKVWPGDVPPTREVLLDLARGDSITLSALRATVHLGAHADGPNHYALGGPAIDQRPLDLYLGRCQVIAVTVGRKIRIQVEDVKTPILAERVLFRTNTFRDPTVFPEDFAALEPALVDYLHHQGVRLVGIDTPSVDLFDSTDLPAHRAVFRHDMAILEGLDLSAVPSGIYELIALPLRLVGFDASPVRAVLRTLGPGPGSGPGGSS